MCLLIIMKPFNYSGGSSDKPKRAVTFSTAAGSVSQCQLSRKYHFVKCSVEIWIMLGVPQSCRLVEDHQQRGKFVLNVCLT